MLIDYHPHFPITYPFLSFSSQNTRSVFLSIFPSSLFTPENNSLFASSKILRKKRLPFWEALYSKRISL